jgi:thymidylate synthase (FAD)
VNIVDPSVRLLWITPDAEQVIERAGRTCYKSENLITPESAGAFILKILKSGHESVIEHASASFLFVTDRGVTHEFVRHRIISFSQESTRYCAYNKEKFDGQISVIEPPGLTQEQKCRWYEACDDAEKAYMKLSELGVPPQFARSVLPTCLKTEIVATANLREWRHILRLRTSSAAHPQIREIMQIVKKTLKQNCPNVFHDFEDKD